MREPTPAELLAFLQEHQFLNPPHVLALGGPGSTAFADGQALALELVERNWLTAYQANQLLQGRGADLLLGPYRLLDQLGEGGMGQVFKARHVSMGRLAAVKIIPKARVSDPVAVGRFYREVRAVAQLSHPNIVTAFEVNQAGKTHFLAMEYVDGIDLARLVQQSGPLPIPQACEFIRQAAVGLQHAHEKGLVHRDIKPGNLMVARPNPDEPPVIKILDFGLARFESESTQPGRLTQFGKIVGTADYIAPEQAVNSRTADIRADIYSLGCSLYYLLTAEQPFPGDDPVEKVRARMLGDAPSVRKVRPEISPALEQILARMMARNPAERYQTPGEVAKALGAHTAKGRQGRSDPALVLDRPITRKPKAEATGRVTAQAGGLSPPETASQKPAFRPTPAEAAPAGGERQPDRKKQPYLALALGGLLVGVGLACGGALVTGLFLWAVRSSPSATSQQPDQPALASNQPKENPLGQQTALPKSVGPEKQPQPRVEEKAGGPQPRNDGNERRSSGRYIITDLGSFPAEHDSSVAMAINSPGQVVVVSYKWGDDRSDSKTLLYDGKSFTDIGSFGGTETVGYSINDSGYIVGMSRRKDDKYNNISLAFVYDGKRMRDIATFRKIPTNPSHGAACAYGINKHGHCCWRHK
jgi:serine/threonine protein kinase